MSVVVLIILANKLGEGLYGLKAAPEDKAGKTK